MAYTISPQEVIKYPPEAIRNFVAYGFEYIENLLFAIPADRLLGTKVAHPYLEQAEARFRDLGWDGTGGITLIWLPSFVLPGTSDAGVTIWHAMQSSPDGESFLLSPVPLPFSALGEE